MDIIKEGVTPQEIKISLIKLLKLYFDNKNVVDNLPDENIGPLAYNIMDISADTSNLQKLQTCLNIFKYAKTINSHELFKSFCDWEKYLIESGRKYINSSLYKVQGNNYQEEDRIINDFQLIGSLIEGCIKPHLMLQLYVLNICVNNNSRYEKIKYLTVGELITSITKLSNVMNIYNFKGIGINQWRNIAEHHNYEIKDSAILCEYGSTKKHNIEITATELNEIIKSICDIYSFLKISHEIFYLDNYQDLKHYRKNIGSKKEMLLINLYHGLILKGFELVTYNENETMFSATIRSLQENNGNTKIAGEIMIRMWLLSKKQNIRLNITEFKNATTLYYETNSTLCEKAYKNQIGLEDIILDLDANTENKF